MEEGIERAEAALRLDSPLNRSTHNTKLLTVRGLSWSVVFHAFGIVALAAMVSPQLARFEVGGVRQATITIECDFREPEESSASEDAPPTQILITPETAVADAQEFVATPATDVTMEMLVEPQVLGEIAKQRADIADASKDPLELRSEVLASLTNIPQAPPQSTARRGGGEPPIEAARTFVPKSRKLPTALPTPSFQASTQMLTVESPSFFYNPLPTYPPEARAKGWSGRVILTIEVDEEGRISRVEVKQSSGYPILDAAAANAVRSWRGQPAKRGGRPIKSQWEQPVDFRQ